MTARSSVPGRVMWAAFTAFGLVLLVLGLAQKFYLGTVTDAFQRDRTGNTLILAGALVILASAAWSRLRTDPLRVTLAVAAPAIVVGCLNLVIGDSLLPHLGALFAVPAALAGIIGGLLRSRLGGRS
ncbi:hypothetical protein [Pseudarthrobacter albicanus]|uniref:hypothetical protein n=1 Tax=Pseudarthrobacter albicanus TaxID=2823873 RepID=UPI001BA4BFAC|nr:hypothetical protein [Pseudarthrobacter albicanus]